MLGTAIAGRLPEAAWLAEPNRPGILSLRLARGARGLRLGRVHAAFSRSPRPRSRTQRPRFTAGAPGRASDWRGWPIPANIWTLLARR